MGTSDNALAAAGMVAGYGDLEVVHGIDLRVQPGEIVALLGPNGAGKSTTLLTLAGALPLKGGRVEFLGRPIGTGLHARARNGLAFVPEERSVIMSMSVRDNLLLGASTVDLAVDIFPELGGLLARQAGLLSGGEQQMVTLARALARQPKVLLADELSIGLGPMIVERLFSVLQAHAAAVGTGVLLVEQQVKRALEVSSRQYLMRRGVIIDGGESAIRMDDIEAAFLHDQNDPVRE